MNAIDKEGETALHGAVYRGGAIPVIQFLIDKGARLDVVNKKGWTPLTVADGVEYTPAVLKRYPEAAALLRKTLRERGLPVPDSTQPGASGAGAPRDRRAGARSTIWNGVFTEEQAKRGEQTYAKSCAKCHAEDLLGSTNAPALVGQAFFARFDRQSADDVLDVIRRTMPQEAPDTLGMPAYADIVSYLLKSNGASGREGGTADGSGKAARDPGDEQVNSGPFQLQASRDRAALSPDFEVVSRRLDEIRSMESGYRGACAWLRRVRGRDRCGAESWQRARGSRTRRSRHGLRRRTRTPPVSSRFSRPTAC